jgi:hypothetical protein
MNIQFEDPSYPEFMNKGAVYMKRTFGFVLLMVLVVISLVGCGSGNEFKVDQYDVDSYKYSSNGTKARFKIVSYQKINDGTNNGIKFLTFVDTQTKVMYVQTEKFQSGYGLAMQVMVDTNGKPLIYEGDF